MRIGIIGSGKMGSTLGTLWAKAGHDVFFSSRHPEELTDLVKQAASAMIDVGSPVWNTNKTVDEVRAALGV